jgi:hypothetical protein
MDVDNKTTNISKKRATSSRSNLSHSTTLYHSQEAKKSTFEKLIKIDFDQYWGNVCSACGDHSFTNCLQNHFGDDLNKLRQSAVSKYKSLVTLTKTQHYSDIHAHLNSLNSKNNKSSSHTEYKIQIEYGVNVSCCRKCYMRFNYITRSQLENSKKNSKSGNHNDINYRKERSRRDGPIIEMNGSQFLRMLERNGIDTSESAKYHIPYAFAPPCSDKLTDWLEKGDPNEYCLQWLEYFESYNLLILTTCRKMIYVESFLRQWY